LHIGILETFKGAGPQEFVEQAAGLQGNDYGGGMEEVIEDGGHIGFGRSGFEGESEAVRHARAGLGRGGEFTANLRELLDVAVVPDGPDRLAGVAGDKQGDPLGPLFNGKLLKCRDAL
jgi:hypothetical protein